MVLEPFRDILWQNGETTVKAKRVRTAIEADRKSMAHTITQKVIMNTKIGVVCGVLRPTRISLAGTGERYEISLEREARGQIQARRPTGY
jgi:hypothetical protein